MEMTDNIKWFVTFRHAKDIWSNHRSYLLIEVILYFLGFLTFCHACRKGGRYVYLWFTVVLHGLVVESISYFVPDIDNFWHAQSMIMLLGKRLPLHIIFVYPVFIYTAIASVTRLRLKSWAEPFAVGLAVVLLDIPFDIVGIKLLFWTWHDTDPNVFERHYSVPWTSYYFHASFAGSFTILFFGTRSLIGNCANNLSKMEADGFFKEIICSLFSGLLAMPLGIMQFIPVYHPLHDIYHVSSEACVLVFLSFYFLVAWTADRNPVKDARNASWTAFFDELGLLVIVHYATFALLAIFERPELIRSMGIHETVGDCNSSTPVQTPLGQVLTKRSYLCALDYDEPYFDFHCLPSGLPPANGLSWYTICGTAVVNYVEYVVVVCTFCLIGFFVYAQMLARSGHQPRGFSIQQNTARKSKHD